MIVHSKHESRIDALRHMDSHLSAIDNGDKPLGERLSKGLEYFADRINLKYSVEQIVARTGRDVDYQGGRTIDPLLYIFIPRFIWPDKPNSSMAGQLFNQEFKISASRDTYIATSQVGELYWNFGWAGLMVGMTLIGALMAGISCSMRFDLLQSLPRFLLLLITVYMLILRSETALAEVFSVWSRASVMLLILNALVPKARFQPNDDVEDCAARYLDKRPGTYRLAKKSNLSEAST